MAKMFGNRLKKIWGPNPICDVAQPYPIKSSDMGFGIDTIFIDDRNIKNLRSSDDHELLVGGWNIFYFSIQLGISSSQLTNSYFQEVLVYHQPDYVFQ